jgi:hypothetical protein
VIKIVCIVLILADWNARKRPQDKGINRQGGKQGKRNISIIPGKIILNNNSGVSTEFRRVRIRDIARDSVD